MLQTGELGGGDGTPSPIGTCVFGGAILRHPFPARGSAPAQRRGPVHGPLGLGRASPQASPVLQVRKAGHLPCDAGRGAFCEKGDARPSPALTAVSLGDCHVNWAECKWEGRPSKARRPQAPCVHLSPDPTHRGCHVAPPHRASYLGCTWRQHPTLRPRGGESCPTQTRVASAR